MHLINCQIMFIGKKHLLLKPAFICILQKISQCNLVIVVLFFSLLPLLIMHRMISYLG